MTKIPASRIGAEPPERFVPAPRATKGIPRSAQTFTTRATPSVVSGSTTAAGLPTAVDAS